MNPLERRLLARQIAKRKGAQLADGDIRGRILASLFDKQREFVEDPNREKSALCPRRAGKTTLVPAYKYSVLLENPNRIARYWAITQDRAYQLMWAPLLRAAKQFDIAIKANEQLMTIWLPNGSEIRLVGADKAKEAEKKRGDPTVLEIIDECSLYGAYLQPLAEDVIGPSLMDHKGTLCYLGTPGIVWDGYWFRLSGPAGEKAVKGVSRHGWDVYDNPFMPHAREEIEALRVKRGWPLDHPTYLREYRGRWVKDTEGLFYSYDPDRNDFETLPELPRGKSWEYTLGWDIGHNDDMALTAWAECPEVSPNIWEAFSWKRPKVGISVVADEVRRLEERLGHIHKKVADAGGVGKVVVQEMATREQLYFEPAKKTDKPGIVRFMNDDFLRGRIKVRKGSPLAQEYATLAKDPDDPTSEDSRCPNHCADAGLYSYRKARHFDHQPQSETPEVGTNAYFDNMRRKMEEAALRQVERETSMDWWER